MHSDGGTFADALRRLGADPGVLVLASLAAGPLRLAEIAQANGGINEETLALALRELDTAGFLARRVDPGPPLRVLYELTERGTELAPALSTLATWVATNG